MQLTALLNKYSYLVNDVSTGGATPLHMCGMGRDNQHATETLIQLGGDIEALDTYGFTPLHRMASNILEVGAQALLKAGADPFTKGACGQTPIAVATSSGASAVLKVLKEFQDQRNVLVHTVTVMGAGVEAVNGVYDARDANSIPEKFALVCEQNGWDTKSMWQKLSGANAGRAGDAPSVWFEAPNKSYIYFNVADQHWWIDGPDGLGVYKARGPPHAVPGYPQGSGGKFGWFALSPESHPLPSILIHRLFDTADGKGFDL